MALHRDDFKLRYRCGLQWEGLDGEGPVRHCAQCGQDVVDLSEMTEAEIRLRRMKPPEERSCVRYRVDPAGFIVTRPDELPSRVVRAGVILVATALAACTESAALHHSAIDANPAGPAPSARDAPSSDVGHASAPASSTTTPMPPPGPPSVSGAVASTVAPPANASTAPSRANAPGSRPDEPIYDWMGLE